MAALQCDICGGKLIARAGGLFECDSCGMQYDKSRIQEMVQEIKGTVKVEGTVEVKGTVKVEEPIKLDVSNSAMTLVRKAMREILRDRNNSTELFRQALDIDPECAEAYLGLCMVICRRPTKEAFADAYANGKIDDSYDYIENYLNNARKYADKELSAYFEELDRKTAIAKKEKRITEEITAQINADEKIRLAELFENTEEVTNKRKLANYISRRLCVTPRWNVALDSKGNAHIAGDRDNEPATVIDNWKYLKSISSCLSHSVALKEDGTLEIAAAGNTPFHYLPRISAYPKYMKAISVASGYIYGIRHDGTVWEYTAPPASARIKGTWDNITAIAASDKHVLGLKADGTVVAAGNKDDKQCYVSDWKDIVSIAVSDYHSIGLRKDGTVVAAGYNWQGQCNVSDWTGIIAIATGINHSVGLKIDGTVCSTEIIDMEKYGYNNGQSNTSSWTDVIAISAGSSGTLAVQSNGKLLYTGNNSCNQKNIIDQTACGTKEQLENLMFNDEYMQKNNEQKLTEHLDKLNEEKIALQRELYNLHGLFTGKRRKELEEKIENIKKELKHY